ncbi:MAG: putative capsid protein [Circular genetic element sp.]|nr:MAG: putative capsid protein [Circular genetic element sp.]
MKSKFKKPYAKRNYRKKKKAAALPYRKSTPMTIQIATKRNVNMRLLFSNNQTYVYDGTKTATSKNALLNYRCNSIYNIQTPTSATSLEWNSQNPAIYDNLIASAKAPNVDSWQSWSQKFMHFIVTGSKLTYSFIPNTTGVPCTLFIHKAGTGNNITTSTTSAQMNLKPYMRRHDITTSNTMYSAGKGVRGSITYSARRFECVKDPIDNSNLVGRFDNTALGTSGSAPAELSNYYISLARTDPASTGALPSGVFRIQLSYVVKLREPTDSNETQIQNSQSLPEMGGFGGAFGFASQL